MMKIGLESNAYFNIYDYEIGLKKLKSHGYDCIDYQNLSNTDCELYKMSDGEFEKYLRMLGAAAKENGVVIYQAHGKWPMNDQTEEGRRDTIKLFIKEIKGCHYLGCRHLVIHPFMPYGWNDGRNADAVFDMNVKMLLELMPYAETFDVIVCVENLPFTELPISYTKEVKRLVEAVNNPYCRVCFDVGHANICRENIAEEIKMLGSTLAVLHIHDNKGIMDTHLIPYQGNIPWDKVLGALKEIGYRGCFSIETQIAPSMPEPAREKMRLALARLIRIMADKLD